MDQLLLASQLDIAQPSDNAPVMIVPMILPPSPMMSVPAAVNSFIEGVGSPLPPPASLPKASGLTTDGDKLTRTRERNRVHARKTRQRKKQHIQQLQNNYERLKSEQLRLKQQINDRKMASALLMMAGSPTASVGKGKPPSADRSNGNCNSVSSDGLTDETGSYGRDDLAAVVPKMGLKRVASVR